AAWKDSRTRVLVVSGGQALVRMDNERADLVFLSPPEAPPGLRMLLGQDTDDVVYFGVNGKLPAPADVPAPAGVPAPGDPSSPSAGPRQDVRAVSLREAGSLLGDRDAGLFTHAVAL